MEDLCERVHTLTHTHTPAARALQALAAGVCECVHTHLQPEPERCRLSLSNAARSKHQDEQIATLGSFKAPLEAGGWRDGGQMLMAKGLEGLEGLGEACTPLQPRPNYHRRTDVSRPNANAIQRQRDCSRHYCAALIDLILITLSSSNKAL